MIYEQDYNNANQVRNCRLSGLRDLKGGTTYVRDMLRNYLNKLIGWGVAGFRIDAAKHMWPGDIYAVANSLNNLNTNWFPSNTRPYIYQEVMNYFFYCVRPIGQTYCEILLSPLDSLKHTVPSTCKCNS